MPIDVSTPRSPGWWVKRLYDKLANRDRQRRLWELHDRYHGRPPLPEGAESAREAYEAFQRKARSNFAELIVSALSERMTVVGFRSSVDDDETGDAEIGEMWERAGLDVASADMHDLMLNMSEAYAIVGPVDELTGAPTVTCEDPRWMIGEPDPVNPRRLIAALKVVHDDADGEDRVHLFLPGEVWVARRVSRTPGTPSDFTLYPNGLTRRPIRLMAGFSEQAWEWVPDKSGELDHPRIPVVQFLNKDAVGEYERHTDLLDRINHQILQRMIVATLQAFRQRAIKGLPLTDQVGNEIDYSGVFTMDPAALWQLPPSAEMWESQQVDLTPILTAVKDDVQHLAAVTRTPMHMLSPSGVNQSAEGASLSREGLVFKARDRMARTGHAWQQVMSLMLITDGQNERADLAKLRTIWAPPERLSLAERADAASKAEADMPRRVRLIKIWGLSPAEADRVMSEWADDELLAAQVAAASVATPGAPGSLGRPATQPASRAPTPASAVTAP